MHIYTHTTHMHTQTHARTQTHIHAQTHVHATHTCTHTHTHTQTCSVRLESSTAPAIKNTQQTNRIVINQLWYNQYTLTLSITQHQIYTTYKLTVYQLTNANIITAFSDQDVKA